MQKGSSLGLDLLTEAFYQKGFCENSSTYSPFTGINFTRSNNAFICDLVPVKDTGIQACQENFSHSIPSQKAFC